MQILYIVSYFFNVDFLWQDLGSQHILMAAFCSVLHFLYAGCMERNSGCIGRMKDSSSALDSYGSPGAGRVMLPAQKRSLETP